ncbi:hypothetical protein J1N35_024496 [Gossypium stocksii]|uniref:Uncharacterized protein n=1 Tax=Gossypium stocksii TaxID=47602 RepID=A0A9D3ZXE8_9ROSI|nr:hypothetical protein J1N35_024496 [Gossypium stocksii]
MRANSLAQHSNELTRCSLFLYLLPANSVDGREWTTNQQELAGTTTDSSRGAAHIQDPLLAILVEAGYQQWVPMVVETGACTKVLAPVS